MSGNKLPSSIPLKLIVHNNDNVVIKNLDPQEFLLGKSVEDGVNHVIQNFLEEEIPNFSDILKVRCSSILPYIVIYNEDELDIQEKLSYYYDLFYNDLYNPEKDGYCVLEIYLSNFFDIKSLNNNNNNQSPLHQQYLNIEPIEHSVYEDNYDSDNIADRHDSKKDEPKIMGDLELAARQFENGMVLNGMKNFTKFVKGKEPIGKDFAYASNYLGCLESYNGNLQKSLENFQKSLEIFFCDCGVGAVSTGAVTNNIGSIFYEMNDTQQALEFHRSAQTILKNLNIEDTSKMADIYYNLGLDYIQKGEYQNALEVLKKATEIYLKHDGEESLLVSETFGAIGRCLLLMGIKQDALDFLRKSFKISERLLGPKHHILADTLEILGCIYCDLKKYKYSEECFYRCLQIRKDIYETHP